MLTIKSYLIDFQNVRCRHQIADENINSEWGADKDKSSHAEANTGTDESAIASAYEITVAEAVSN